MLALTATIRDPSSDRYSAVQELRLLINTQEDIEKKPNPQQVKKMLLNCVQEYNNSLTLTEFPTDETPWFDAWKKTFLNNFETCDHEFISAHVGVLFFIAENDLDNFRDVLTKLQSKVKSISNIKWFFPNFLKYCIVLSTKTPQTNDTNSTEPVHTIHPAFNELKSFYDANRCTWLSLDSCQNEIHESVKIDDSEVYQSYTSENQDPLSFLSSNQDDLDDKEIKQAQEKPPPEQLDHSRQMYEKCEELLRKAITQTVLPWCEQKLALLWESLASRKGLRRSLYSATRHLVSAMSSSTINQKASNQSIVYSLDANEMQHRKFADLAMCLGLYEIAYNSYYAARKEFQGEGAWTYYAGASESAAFASILLNKYQRHYLDHAISTYLEVAKLPTLAARATLIATDAIKDSSPGETANLFMRLPSDDSDLRSALFLEQAAKCFNLATPSRKRKAAFYYVLAGHRYNKCNLKKLSLACYMRYLSSPWTSALEHVNYTTAKLYLQICSLTAEQELAHLYREKGLYLLRINSEKELFFSEYIKELKKVNTNNSHNTGVDTIFSHLNVPIVKNIVRSGVEWPPGKGQKQNCFLNEPILLNLTLYSNFNLELQNLTLNCDNNDIECSSTNLTLEAGQDLTSKFSMKSSNLCDFSVTQLTFEIDGTKFNQKLNDKWCKMLKFTCLKTLPPIDISIRIGHYSENMNSIELLTGQIVDLSIKLVFQEALINPDEYDAKMVTNANLLGIDKERKEKEKEEEGDYDSSQKKVISIALKEVNTFQLQAPSTARTHSIFFKITYCKTSEPYKERTYTRNIDLFVRECIQQDCCIENVVSLRNLSSNYYVQISSGDEKILEIDPGLTGSILARSSSIDWMINNAKGKINIAVK